MRSRVKMGKEQKKGGVEERRVSLKARLAVGVCGCCQAPRETAAAGKHTEREPRRREARRITDHHLQHVLPQID
jgi:hypothetical protein